MEYKKIISGTAAAILAVSLLGSCGKVEIQQKKEKTSVSTTTTPFSFDGLIESDTSSSNKQMSGLVSTPVLEDDDIAGTVKQTTTKRAVTTTTVKQIIPATTTKPTITTTTRQTTTTTTTTRATTSTHATFSTYSSTTPTTSRTTTSTTTASSSVPTQPTQNPNPDNPNPPAPDTVSVTAQPDHNPGSSSNALAGRNKLNINGGSAGLGDSFSSNSGYFGSQSGSSQWINANGRTVTEHYYGDVVVAETDGAISYIEISGDSTASTSNGLQTGMTLSQMEAICGTNYYVEDNCQYTYYDGTVSLSVLVIDDEVIKIEVCDNGMY
ncbi:MAG: hypothetical protein K6B74_02910 [Ruminococcus sp.]|nr:hypothetical protein [Ruminococcus sp.]